MRSSEPITLDGDKLTLSTRCIVSGKSCANTVPLARSILFGSLNLHLEVLSNEMNGKSGEKVQCFKSSSLSDAGDTDTSDDELHLYADESAGW